MIDVVFISDLHLHPKEYAIQERFTLFLEWVQKNSIKNIYILGDFFHVWAGDDTINDWSRGIAEQLHSLKKQGINLFYMHGNRDFLLGEKFAKLAGWTILSEPTIIHLGKEKIMLAHGDRYCTKDLAHQRFRLLTRNKIFSIVFLSLSVKYRERLVNQVRARSQNNVSKSREQMDVVAESVIRHMQNHGVTQLIHGHTHKPGIVNYMVNSEKIIRYTLSDWDDSPKLLCYDTTKGIYFSHL
ncbi:UDP-2,3-diacylglucosamine diphosphatase [Legionella sp.]|uniref:UDP-2,3-diacylglucosamine diphosphatase n=1 Tax=Legionella sp. TaxID=459 RepID=UPI003C8A79EF